MAERKLRLPSWFGDRMILQQRVRIRVYGNASPGAEVHLTLERFPSEHRLSSGDTEYGIIFQESDIPEDDGFFEFKLPFIEASFDKFRMTVECEDERLIFQEILFGEVWLAAGEGNICLPVEHSDLNGLLDRLQDIPGLRFFTMNEDGLPAGTQDYCPEPLGTICGGQWLNTEDRGQMAGVSALALGFAAELSRELKWPVAVYLLAAGPSCIHSWLPRGVVEQDAIIKNHVREIRHYRDAQHWNEMPPAEKKEERVIRKKVLNRDEAAHTPPFSRMNQPGALFNHKLAPFTGLALRGVLWAQGESDCQYPDYYRRAFSALSAVFEQMFQAPVSGLCLIYPQLHPAYVSSLDFSRLALFNEALAAVRRKLPLRAGLVTVYDLPLDHPPHNGRWQNSAYPAAKRQLAERMRRVALGLAYHYDLPDSAPECCAAELVGNKLILSFENAGKGIALQSGETQLKAFTICGEDRRHILAEAKELYGVRVIVWQSEIATPLSCSYAFSSFNQDANLCGSDGMPVVAFRLERETVSMEKPRSWMYCDRLEAWRVPSLDLVTPKTSGRRQPGYYPLWKVLAGKGSFRLEKDNKRQGTASLFLEYRKADERPIVFGPALDYASDYPPLNLLLWSEISIHLFNADHRKKRLQLRLADTNGRETVSDRVEIDDILAWQSISFTLKNAPVDLMRLSSLEFILQDPDERGGLFIDAVTFQGLSSGNV